MMNIGFVGLGHMGLPMATNLLKAGYKVTGYDLQASALEQFEEAGGNVAHQLQGMAKDQDVIITMLQTGQQVLHVCLGIDGLFSKTKEGALFIDCSTIDVQTSREIHQHAKSSFLFSLDAPVSGGVAGATAGTLTFMVGGDSEAYGMGHHVLSAMGQKIIHTGSAGSGQAAKICNNMILGISMVGICEAFVLAEELGLAPEKLFEVVNNASGQCWAMSKYVPLPDILDRVPANNDYKPGFAANMMLKDLLLSQQTASAAAITTPLGAKATQLYQQFIDQGFGSLDFSAIIKFLAEK